MKQNVYIILASGSPRRKEIFKNQMNLEFKVMTSNIEEKTYFSEPERVVMDLSEKKCSAVSEKIIRKTPNNDWIEETLYKGTGILVVSADTVVSLDGKILGKPKDKEDALNILMNLSGKIHSVYTGVRCELLNWDNQENLIRSDEKFGFYCKTDVKMYDLSRENIVDYIATGEPMDKAGAYGIQGIGCRLVEKIDGDYNNVVGFPAGRFLREMDLRGFFSE